MILMEYTILLYGLGSLLLMLILDLWISGKYKVQIMIFAICLLSIGYYSLMRYGEKVIILDTAERYDISLDTLNSALESKGFKPLDSLPYKHYDEEVQ